MFYFISAALMGLVIREAFNGRQKHFARFGVAILFGNMVLFNLEVYSVSVSNFIAYLGLLTISAMLLFRIGWLLKNTLTNYKNGE